MVIKVVCPGLLFLGRSRDHYLLIGLKTSLNAMVIDPAAMNFPGGNGIFANKIERCHCGGSRLQLIFIQLSFDKMIPLVRLL